MTRKDAKKAVVIACLFCAALLQTVDATIVNVSLPTIMGNLGASIDEATWIVTGYIAPAVIIIPLTPWLQRRLGRKRYFLSCIAGFTIASVMCGLSKDIAALIAWRVAQGLFGGGLVPTAQALLKDVFGPKRFNTSQAVFTIAVVVGPSIGPILGGWITDAASWPWIFFVNVIPGIIALGGLWLCLDETGAGQKLRIDGFGAALLIAGIASLQYVLDQGERWYWLADPTVRLASIIAVGALMSFILWEIYGTKNPIVDLRVLLSPAVSCGSLINFLVAFTVIGQAFIAPQFLVGSLGFTATLTGTVMVARAIPNLLLAIPVGVLARKLIPPVWLVGVGLALATVTSIVFSSILTTDTSPRLLMWVFAGVGVSLALLITPLNIAVVGSVTGQDVPKAMSFMNLSLQLGGSTATALLVTFLDRRQAFHYSTLAASITLSRAPVAHALAHGMTTSALGVLLQQQASALAYADASLFIAVTSLSAVPLLLGFRRKSAPVDVPNFAPVTSVAQRQ